MNPLFWAVVFAIAVLLLFIVGVTLGKIKRGRASAEARIEDRRKKSRVSGEDD